MIQFNLLPDIKLDFIKSRKLKRLITTIAVGVSGASLAMLIIMVVTVKVVQQKQLKDLKKETDTAIAEVKETPNIDKILTVQNQLKSLPGLHGQKPAASRLPGYVAQVTPSNISIATVNVDFVTFTMSIKGQAQDLRTVNTFVDTLKFTDYATIDDQEKKTGKAFSKVTLSTFSVAERKLPTDKVAGFNIIMSFDPAIFDNQRDMALQVPNAITTRSEVSSPDVLFEEQSADTQEDR